MNDSRQQYCCCCCCCSEWVCRNRPPVFLAGGGSSCCHMLVSSGRVQLTPSHSLHPQTHAFPCFIPHWAPVRVCLQHLRRRTGGSSEHRLVLVRAVYFLTRRSPAALREEVRDTERFTSIHGITASNGTHNSEERNTNTTLRLRPSPPPPSPLLSVRMAQILPIRFQEHLQVKPHGLTQHSWLSARRR